VGDRRLLLAERRRQGGEVGAQRVELADGARGVGGLEALVELVLVEPARGVVLADLARDALAVVV
jgi:hypothetical protein